MSVQGELERIRKRNGGLLRPEDVVRAARPKSSPLHDRFDWDDGTAAHSWRVEQARHLIRVFVQVVDAGGCNAESRMFVALSADKSGGGGYRILTDVLGDDTLREALLRDAFEDMRRFTQKYAALKELADVFMAMNTAQRRQAGKALAAR
ncbi:MAG: hypothetical protein WC728_03900 [Elusimicrobiota bacterium]